MIQQKRDYDHMLRFIMLGDFNVGKSSLLHHLIEGNQLTSIASDYRSKTLLSCGKKIKLQLWDTEGQERFHISPKHYFEKATAVLLVYDITNRESFNDIKNFWIKEIEEYAGIGVQMALIGNKCDLSTKRAVPKQQAMTFANEHSMMFLEVSSKTGENLQNVLPALTEMVVRQLENTEGKKQQMNKMSLKSAVIRKGNQTRSSCF